MCYVLFSRIRRWKGLVIVVTVETSNKMIIETCSFGNLEVIGDLSKSSFSEIAVSLNSEII